MTTLEYFISTAIICIVYLLLLLNKRKYKLFLPCTIHTFTWLVVCLLIIATITGYFGEYNPNGDAVYTYDYVAPFIFGIVISSIFGFSVAHHIRTNKQSSVTDSQVILKRIDFLLNKYHWILYVCLALGVLQTAFILSAVGFNNLGDYRVAAVTLERTGYGAISQQFSGHATILGCFYFALLAYKHAHDGINIKRFLLDALLLSSTNLAIAGRVWIITVILDYIIVYIWQLNIINKKFFNRDFKKLAIIFALLLGCFSIMGSIRNGGSIEEGGFLKKFLYYTDGSRITNMTLAQIPEGSFTPELGKCEFLTKWIDSPNLKKFDEMKSVDIGIQVTVSSSLPYLYLDYGFWGGILMWGVFCCLIEWGALSMKYTNSILGIFFFLELSKLLYQSPIGAVFQMEIPVVEWLIILYVFRKHLHLTLPKTSIKYC